MWPHLSYVASLLPPKCAPSPSVQHTGTAYLGFDSTSTWFYSKTVKYAASCAADELC